MGRSFTLTLNGNEPITSISYIPPIELTNGEYECALIDFHMYNSVPNIDINNNLFHIGDKVIQLPIGSCELNDIYDFLKNKLKDYDLEKTFQMENNNNTLQVHITSTKEPIYFNRNNSIGKWLGFNKKNNLPRLEKNIYI